MSGILTQDKIAELVEAAKHGELREEDSSGHRRAARLRKVDFSRPTKFTSDHQRRISRAMETFCQTAVTRLSAELRSPIELEVINSMQLTWSTAQSQLPVGSLAARLDVQPVGTSMLLSAEQSFVLTALECLLGGAPDRPPRERRFSEIDWSLTRRLIGSMVNQLSLVWQDLGGVSLRTGEIDFHNEASQQASVSEPTFVVLIETRINKHSAALALLIPWVAIEPVAQRISGRDPLQDEADSEHAHEIERALSAVPVTVRAEIAARELSVEDVLALEPGSVLKLGARAEEGVTLYAENIKLGIAQPGCNGPRRAVQVRGHMGSGA